MRILSLEVQDESTLEKIGVEGKKLISKLIKLEEWDDISEDVEKKVKEYKELGYDADEIDIYDEYEVGFRNDAIKVRKSTVVRNQHTQRSIVSCTKFIYYLSEFFTRSRNELGFQLNNLVEKELEDEEDEDDC